MSNTFLRDWYAAMKDPSRWDGAGTTFSTIEKFFERQAALQAMAAAGRLPDVAACLEYARGYESYYKALAKVNAEMAAQYATLTPDQRRIFAELRVRESQLKFTVDRLKDATRNTDSLPALNSRLASAAVMAAKQLGAFVGLAQIAQQGSLDDIGKTSAGVLVGYYTGAGVWAGGTALGLTASGPVGWLATVVAMVGVSYVTSKGTELAWERIVSGDGDVLRRQLLEQAKKLFTEGTPEYREVEQQLRFSVDKLGRLDGTWLEGFTDLVPMEKARLTVLLFAPQGVPYADNLLRDLDELFSANLSQGQKALRDKMFVGLAAAARQDGTGSQRRVTVEGPTITINLEGADAAATSLRDTLRGNLSVADQRGFAITGPTRFVFGTDAGTHAATGGSDTLLIGSAGVDGLIGGAGNDDLIGGAGQDILLGGAGVDDLFGGADDDLLDGGAGGDWLFGGDGNDTYQLTTGQLFDVIQDSDGNGKITVDGRQLTGGKKAADNYWISDDKEWGYLVTENGDLIISRGSNPDNLTIRNWKDGGGNQLGIILSDDPAEEPPPPDQTLNGDFFAMLVEHKAGDVWRYNMAGQQVVVLRNGEMKFVEDTLGNLVQGGDVFVQHNTIFGGALKDTINGLTGNDLLAGRGGNDTIDGGTGNDMIGGGEGDDRILGGEGNDFISSSADVDPVYQQFSPTDTWDRWGLPAGATLVASGASWGVYTRPGSPTTIWSGISETHTGDQSDYVDAGKGDDQVIASWGADYVLGGEGKDTVHGLAGDDAIEGGDDDDNLAGDGIVEPDFLNTTEAARHGSDYVHGGKGNDTIKGDGGADDLYGGADNDTIYGDSGVGSTDKQFVAVEFHGDDYIDGGAGDDYAEGNGGSDAMYGGAGADNLWGDTSVSRLDAAAKADLRSWGDDYLDGEAGNDTLVGGGGSDVLYGGADDDQLLGEQGGTSLPDEVHGSDYLDGEAGNDTLYGGGKDDQLFGGTGADFLHGDDSQANVAGELHGDDYLDGEAGEDTLYGGGGSDALRGGSERDLLWGDAAESQVAGTFHGDDVLDGEDGNDQLVGGGGADALAGGSGDDLMFGDDAQSDVAGQFHGADNLDGGDGNDAMVGGGGGDMLSGGAGDDYMLGDDALDQLDAQWHGNDVMYGGAGNDTLFGGQGNDDLYGDDGDDYLDSGDGFDILAGGAGSDTYGILGSAGIKFIQETGGVDYLYLGWDWGDILIRKGSYVLVNQTTGQEIHIEEDENGHASIEFLRLNGDQWLSFDELVRDLGVEVQGTDEDDYLMGTPYDDRFQASTGADVLVGLGGDDWYVLDTPADVVVEEADGGDDGVEVTFSYDLRGTFLEHVDATAAAGDIVVTGNDADNELGSGSGNDLVAGGAGDDSLWTGDGNDTLDGGAGADFLAGEGGDDTYHVDGSWDQVWEDFDPAGGHDTVHASGDGWSMLEAGTETLYLVGEASWGFGNALDNAIHGNAFANALYGGLGSDLLYGYAGDDTYFADGRDTVFEGADGGNDTLVSNTSRDLSAAGYEHIENVALVDRDASWAGFDDLEWDAWDAAGNALDNLLEGNAQANVLAGAAGSDTLQGASGDDMLLGGEGADVLEGGDGNDTLDGGAGADLLVGGYGDDVFLVDDAGDVATDDPWGWGGGHDVLHATVTATLGAGIDDGFLSGAGDFGLVGNDLTNLLVGNDGSNLLHGGLGQDTLVGGLGDDTFVVQDADDIVVEHAGEGVDTIVSNHNWTLADGFENLTLLSGDGLYPYSGIGNAADNVITAAVDVSATLQGLGGNDTLAGGDGNDWLYGGAGDDRMAGGRGDDVYDVDSSADTIVEAAGEGIDYVHSSASVYTLSANVDHLYFTTAADAIGTGNALANEIAGGAGNDLLSGLGGDDVLRGGSGADTMDGGAGNDVYVVEDLGDVAAEAGGDGVDLVQSQVDSYTLGAGIENLDVVYGGEGVGNELDNILSGGWSHDELYGLDGNDTFFGQQGYDLLVGGAGNDTYHVEMDDWYTETPDIVELAGEGFDTIVLHDDEWNSGWNDYQMADTDVEALDASRLNAGANLAGNGLDNVITGSVQRDDIRAGEGNDQVRGDPALPGRFIGDSWVANDVRWYFEDLQLGGQTPGWEDLKAHYGIVLELQPEHDPADFVVLTIHEEQPGGVYDPRQVYWPRATWGVDGDGQPWSEYGNELFVYMDGNISPWGSWNFEQGLRHWAADHEYEGFVANVEAMGGRVVADTGTEVPAGFGRVSSTYWPLADERQVTIDWPLENFPSYVLDEIGTDFGGDTIDGEGGNDTIDGGYGDDDLYGGDGNDVLIGGVSTTGMFEASTGGEAYIAAASSDFYGLTFTVPIHIPGGNDTLDGGAGIDLLMGGDGDDEYWVDGQFVIDEGGGLPALDFCDADTRFGMDRAPQYAWTTDVVVEHDGEGYDIVIAAASVDLRNAAVEEVWLTEDGDVLDIDAATGAGEQAIFGNAGANRLDGGAGADYLEGGAGDDTYVADADDWLVEAEDGGWDTVRTEVDGQVLGDSFEALVLDGSADLSGHGNAGDNDLVGNSGNNLLEGGAGEDYLAGWRGDDTLRGGADWDLYLVARGDGRDVIEDLEGEGTIHFSADIGLADLEFRADGNDLLIVVGPGAGSSEGAELRLRDWMGAVERVNHLSFCGEEEVFLDESLLNAQPVAFDDAVLVTEDGPAAQGNLLANDEDADGDSLQVAAAGSFTGSYGTLVLAADGSLRYALDNSRADVQSLGVGAELSDTFEYTVADPAGATSSAWITVTIAGTNDTPFAQADTGALSEDGVLAMAGALLANDGDVDAGDILRVTTVGNHAGRFGTLSVAADGTYSYALANESDAVQTLAAGQVVTETFDYAIADAAGAGAASTLTLRIVGTNDGPVAADDAAALQEDGAPAVAIHLLGNDSDRDAGDRLAVTTTGTFAGAYGILTVDAAGGASYVLANDSAQVQALRAGQQVTDRFQYAIADVAGAGAQAWVTITIAGANDSPLAAADFAAVSEDGVAQAAGDLLANDADVDAGDRLAVMTTGTFAGQYGSLTVNADGSYSYVLANGSDAVQSLAAGQRVMETFSYTVADDGPGGSLSAQAALTVQIDGANDAPLLVTPAADVEAEEGELLAIDLPDTMFRDIDQGDVLGYAAQLASGDALPGWLRFDADGLKFTGTPPEGTAGQAFDIRLTAFDRAGATASDVFRIAIDECKGLVLVGGSGRDMLVGSDCDDTLDGRRGADTMKGRDGDDTYYVDTYGKGCDPHGKGNEGVGNGEDPPPPGHDYNWNDGPGTSPGHPGSKKGQGGGGSHGGGGWHGGGGASASDLVVELFDQGWDTVYSSVSYVLPQHVEALRLQGSAALDGSGNDQSNWLVGNAAANAMEGNGGNDLVSGGGGSDCLYGDAGNDVIEGQDGSDNLLGGAGTDALLGGQGSDMLQSGTGRGFLAGGKGDDVLVAGEGATVVAFNRGDGVDRLQAQGGMPLVLSLGGGIRLEDVALRRAGSDLIVDVGSNESVALKSWYSGNGNRPKFKLQLVTGAAANHDPQGDALHNTQLTWLDGQALVNAFDQASKGNPKLSRWDIMNGALAAHLGGSDSAALGGDLSYQYGMQGTLAGIGLDPATAVLAEGGFGTQAQALRGAQELRTGMARILG